MIATNASVPEMPMVSIIVPTYNRLAAVRRCVKALCAQDYPADHIEILIVDDGSSVPPSFDLVPGTSTVRVLALENRGPAAARNSGAAEARGSILAFTDDDCCPAPSWVSTLVASLEQHPQALVGGETVNALTQNVWAEASQLLVSYLYSSFGTAREMRPFFTSNNVAMSRDGFAAVGGFDESFLMSAAEDRDLCERWTTHGRLQHVPTARVDHFHTLRPLTFLRQHYRYGRGALHLARRRMGRGERRPIPEPWSFYGRMLHYPVRKRGVARGIVLSALIGVSLVANVAGMAAELVRPAAGSKVKQTPKPRPITRTRR